MNKLTELIGSKLVSMYVKLKKEIEVRDNRFRRFRLKKTKEELEALHHWQNALVEAINIVRNSEEHEKTFIKDVFHAGFLCKKSKDEEKSFSEFLEKEFSRKQQEPQQEINKEEDGTGDKV